MSRKGAHEGRPYVRLGGGRGWIPAFVLTGVGSTREKRREGGDDGKRARAEG